MGLMITVSADVEETVRDEATAALAERGLTVSDAIRILLSRVAVDRSFANGLVSGAEPIPERRNWDDFFDSPGIEIEEPEDLPFEAREAF